MSSESKKRNLPFEPRQKKKKVAKNPPVTSNVTTPSKPKNSAFDRQNAQLSAIPDAVSKRMIRRMALFSGIPTGLGISSFFIFYGIVSHQLLKIPNVAVVFVTMGLFGLGVLGLTYGILSTSWEEHRLGSWWGWQEFRLNFGRMVSAWQAAGQEAKEKVKSNN